MLFSVSLIFSSAAAGLFKVKHDEVPQHDHWTTDAGIAVGIFLLPTSAGFAVQGTRNALSSKEALCATVSDNEDYYDARLRGKGWYDTIKVAHGKVATDGTGMSPMLLHNNQIRTIKVEEGCYFAGFDKHGLKGNYVGTFSKWDMTEDCRGSRWKCKDQDISCDENDEGAIKTDWCSYRVNKLDDFEAGDPNGISSYACWCEDWKYESWRRRAESEERPIDRLAAEITGTL